MSLFTIVLLPCVLKAFCRMAIDYGVITQQKDIVTTSNSFYVAANWGKRLAEHQVGIKFVRENRMILHRLFVV